MVDLFVGIKTRLVLSGHLAGLILLISGFSGCHTVSSEPAEFHPTGRPSITYALPKGLIKVVIKKESGSDPDATITPHYVPDLDHFYRLNLRPSAWSDDEYQVKVNAGTQLLDSITNSHDDQTDAIIKKVVDLGVGISRLAATGTLGTLKDNNSSPPDSFTLEKIFEFSKLLNGEQELEGYTIRAEKLKMDYPTRPEIDRRSERTSVYYRSGLPYIVEVSQGTEVLLNHLVMMPDESPIEELSLKRGAFVKVAYTLDFENGMPSSIKASRPSEILGIVSLPIEILKSISTILPYQRNLESTNNEAALIQAQTTLLQNQARYLDELNKTKDIDP